MSFNFSPTDVTTSITILPKDRYKVQIGAPTPWAFEREGKPAMYGVRYNLTVLEGDKRGKKIIFNGNQDNEIGQQIFKRFLGAAQGHYWRNESQEDEYNEWLAGKYTDPVNDFRADPATKDVGPYFTDAKGSVIFIDVDINQANDGSGKQFQQFKNFYPMEFEFED